MENFLLYIGKSALAAGAFYLVYLALFQNQKQFTFNRIYLPVSLAVSFLIPLITFTTVNYVEPVPVESSPLPVFTEPMGTPAVVQSQPQFTWEWHHYLFAVYTAGTLLFLFRLLLGHGKAWNIIRKSRVQQLFNSLVNISKKDIHPFSFFNKIVFSENTLSHPHLEMIVEHEKIHVKEKHTLDILFTEILFLLQWFNPFAWLLKDAVKNNLEYKTDHEIAKTTDAQTYQLAMLALADKQGVAPFLTALNGSQLKSRIIMMKKKSRNKFGWLKQLALLPLLAMLVMGLAEREVRTEFVNQDINNKGIVNEIINDVTSRNGKVAVPYRWDKNVEKYVDFASLKIVMDGKEISKNSPELEKLNASNVTKPTLGKVISLLVPDMKNYEISRIHPQKNGEALYIRTTDYIPGTNKEFETKATMHISLEKSNINVQQFAIDNRLVDKKEFIAKGKDGFRFLTYLPVELAKNKYGEKITGRVLDAQTGGANYFISRSKEQNKFNSSQLKIVVDGKEIPTNSPELKDIQITPENLHNSKYVTEIVDALNIDLDDIKSSKASNNSNNPFVYIRTKNFVPGTNKEFEKQTDTPEKIRDEKKFRQEIIGKWVLADAKNQKYKKSEVEYFTVKADSTATIYTEQYGEKTGTWFWKIAKNTKIKSMSFDVDVDVFIHVMQTAHHSRALILTLKEKEGQLILSAGNSIYKKEYNIMRSN